jgi:hypothetical protein
MCVPLAVVCDADSAFRELVRASLEAAGYLVIEAAGSPQLASALGTHAALTAPRVFLALGANLAVPCRAGISSLGLQRSEAGLPLPQTVIMVEFGTPEGSVEPVFALCKPAGHLEKPFDLGLLQSIASGVRS